MTDRPAWGYGLVTIAGDGSVLDTWFRTPTLGSFPAGRDQHIAPADFASVVGRDARRNVTVDFAMVQINLAAAPSSTPDAYLRLHLLSHLVVAPNTINLDGLFGHLPTVARHTRSTSSPPHRLRLARPGANCGCLTRASRSPPRPRHHSDA